MWNVQTFTGNDTITPLIDAVELVWMSIRSDRPGELWPVLIEMIEKDIDHQCRLCRGADEADEWYEAIEQRLLRIERFFPRKWIEHEAWAILKSDILLNAELAGERMTASNTDMVVALTGIRQWGSEKGWLSGAGPAQPSQPDTSPRCG